MKTRQDKNKIRKDLINQVFGKLTVIEFSHWGQQGKNKYVSFWTCKCECGNFTKVKTAHLNRGDTKSCGCHRSNKLPEGQAAFNRLLENYQRHAKNRNYKWNLSEQEFQQLTKQNCYYCKQEPNSISKSIRGNGEYIYNGVDRINNEPFYSINNCVSCCKLCNRMKSDLTLEEFKEHIKKIWVIVK